MSFQSILYQEGQDPTETASAQAPEYFHDLNLDQIVEAIVAEHEEFDLKPFFYTPLKSVGAILYRHEVMRDLEYGTIFEPIASFAKSMGLVRTQIALADKLYEKLQQRRWFLRAVQTYCSAVHELRQSIVQPPIASHGLVTFRAYVADYAGSTAFQALVDEANGLADELAQVQYVVRIKGDDVHVHRYDAEPDYSEEVAETFEKFQQSVAKDYRVTFDEPIHMNHVEEKILELVALLYPQTFSRLDEFYKQYRTFVDPVLQRFDREIRFYIAYTDYMSKFTRIGLRFCYPALSGTNKAIRTSETFDLALANTFVAAETPIVCNDFYLRGNERIFVVSGPNQGGKTTFARTFGQLHHLASIGCPVPGRSAQLFLFDSMFTHFEREENIERLSGKLYDDLVRIHAILEQATPQSIVILNEIFNSTTLRDAVFLARKILQRLSDLDLLCICVTFLDELASLNEKTVSMTSTVLPDNPAVRTYKVIRHPADGRSYAISLAEKYRLTHDILKTRIPS